MLARGPAGYRFTAKALQHALPDAKIERADIVSEPQKISTKLWLSGALRGSSEKMNTRVTIALQCLELLGRVARHEGADAVHPQLVTEVHAVYESGEGVTTAGERGEQRQDEYGSTSSLGDAGWSGT